MKSTRWVGLAVRLMCAAAILAAGIASASEGLYLLGNDTLQIGRADSGTASPRSAYWVLLNPASLVDLERRIDVTAYVVKDRFQCDPHGLLANPFSGSLQSDHFEEIPALGLVWPLKDGHGTLGAGLYAIGGEVEYNDSRTWLGKVFYDNRDRELAMHHYQMVTGYGYRFDNGWALGAGLQASVTRFSTDQLTLNMRTAHGDAEWDTALGLGFNLGIYKRWEKISVGAMYKSRQWSQPLEDYADLLKQPLEYPHMFRAGIAVRPVERVELTLDYEYQMWSGVSPFQDKMLNSGLEWGDIHGLKVGIEWKANDRWTLMTGWSHADSVISPNHLFLNALVPSIIEDHFTVGFSYQVNEHHLVHFAYLRSLNNRMKDPGDGDLLSRLGKGTEIEVSADSFALGYTYLF